MLSIAELTVIRRSAAMAPLSATTFDEVFDTCTQLLQERAQIAGLLERLPTSFGEVRQVLNELQAIVT